MQKSTTKIASRKKRLVSVSQQPQKKREDTEIQESISMTNQNGQLILQALQNLDEPSTVTKIVTHIADTAGVHPNDVKESVQETLNGGVRYGYIQRTNRKYYAVPVDLETLAGDEPIPVSIDTNMEAANNGDLEDRSSRRRKRSRRSRSRRSSRRRRRSRR